MHQRNPRLLRLSCDHVHGPILHHNPSSLRLALPEPAPFAQPVKDQCSARTYAKSALYREAALHGSPTNTAWGERHGPDYHASGRRPNSTWHPRAAANFIQETWMACLASAQQGVVLEGGGERVDGEFPEHRRYRS